MDLTITASVIATIISVTISTLLTLWITNSNKVKNLDDQLDAILKIAIQYPYLESETFTLSWSPDFNRDDEKYLRYDVYCVLLFNFLSKVAEHYNFNNKKIEQYLAIKDWVRLHEKYWLNPTNAYENVDSYDKKFVSLIKTYIK